MDKKKKKVPTLPNHISPFIPDASAGVDTLNNNMNVSGEALGESTQNKLSEQEKDKLADFVEKTDDVEEIKTYINGLQHKNESVQNNVITSLNEWVDATDELEDELENHLIDCDGNIYNELPHWCQLYLNEFDGPWISYGKLPSGTYFYSDDYDTMFFVNQKDFLSDMKYNLLEVQKQYQENPNDYDYSIEFTNLLESDLNVKESLTEAGGYPDDMGHRAGDYGPRSPWYDGPEPQEADINDVLEVEFSQRGIISDNYWETAGVGFDEDLDKIEYYPEIYFEDEEIGEIDSWYVQEALYDMFSSSKFQQELPLSDNATYEVKGTVEIPYSISDITYYTEIDKEYESVDKVYDTSNMRIKFYPNQYKIKRLHIERISW